MHHAARLVRKYRNQVGIKTGLTRLLESHIGTSHAVRKPSLVSSIARPYSIGTDIPKGRLKIVILGSGWAAASLARHVDTSKYAITVISQLNHMVFTPLLPGAAVGSVEARTTALSTVAIQPELKRAPHAIYLAKALTVDPQNRTVSCLDEAEGTFEVNYDLLAIATGSQGSTFGTPGVVENAHFLRNVSQAIGIRKEIIKTFTLAFSPGQTEKEKRRLLSTLIVGGGPTGVEFAGALCDFIASELRDFSGYRAGQARVTIVEAAELLSNFDSSLRNYAVEKLKRQGVTVIEKGMVKELTPTEAKLSNGQVIPFGICVWSTGVGPTDFISSLPFAKTAKGRLAVDKFLRVLGKNDSSDEADPDAVDERSEEHKEEEVKRSERLEHVDGVFALGDCCANIGCPLPALAQVAEQQGKFLASTFNKGEHVNPAKPFVWKQLGSMATIGGQSAIIQLGSPGKHINWKGALILALLRRIHVLYSLEVSIFLKALYKQE